MNDEQDSGLNQVMNFIVNGMNIKQQCGFGFDIGVLFLNENSTIFTH